MVVGRQSLGPSRRARPAAPRRGARVDPIPAPPAPSIVRCLLDRVRGPRPIAAPGTGVRGERPPSEQARLGRAAGRGNRPPSRVGDPTDEPTGARRTARSTRHLGPLASRIDTGTRALGVRRARSTDPIDRAGRVHRTAMDRRGILAARPHIAARRSPVAVRRIGDRAVRHTVAAPRHTVAVRRRPATDRQPIATIRSETVVGRRTAHPGVRTARAVRRLVDRGSPRALDRRRGLAPVSPSRHRTCSVPRRSWSPAAARSRRSSRPAGPRSDSLSSRSGATPSNSSSCTPHGCGSRSWRSRAGR